MQPVRLVNRLIYILAAIFICTTIFAYLQKLLDDWGIALAFVINSTLAIKLIKKYPKSSWQRIIGLSILFTMATMALMLVIGLSVASYLINQAL